jgi:hypothetical protein
LQTLVATFAAPAAFAGIIAPELCRSDRAGGPLRQAPHDDACLACPAGHCAGTAADADRRAIIEPWPVIAMSRAGASRPGAPPVNAAGAQPHSPRAPPLG